VSGIIIHRSHHAQQYVVVPNAIARNTRLSFTARGLLTMLLSLPPEWHVTSDMLAKDNPDSRGAIRKAMAELRELGYVEVHREQGARGRWRTRIEVFDTPLTERVLPAFGATSGNEVSPQVAPNAGIPAAGRPAAGQPAVKRSTGIKTPPPPSFDLRAELASLGADQREIKHIVHKIENDPRVRSPAAYLRKALANGDGPEIIAQARGGLAAEDATGQPLARPDWCGQCDEQTRLIEVDDGDRAAHCPRCHPLSARSEP
jgi:hypothetical protein